MVANGFCSRAQVQLGYGIGIPDPISIFVNSYGTSQICGYDDEELDNIVRRNFDLKAGRLIETLNLRRPIFKKTTLYGHFLKTGEEFTWECVKDLSREKKDDKPCSAFKKQANGN